MEEGGSRNGDPASASGGKRRRRKGKRGKAKGRGGGSTSEPEGSRDAEGATAGADGSQDERLGLGVHGGRPEGNNGDAVRKRFGLGVHGGPGAGRNGGVEGESPPGGRGDGLRGGNGNGVEEESPAGGRGDGLRGGIGSSEHKRLDLGVHAGRPEGNNSDAEQKSLGLGVHDGPRAGRNGGVEEESPPLGGQVIQPLPCGDHQQQGAGGSDGRGGKLHDGKQRRDRGDGDVVDKERLRRGAGGGQQATVRPLGGTVPEQDISRGGAGVTTHQLATGGVEPASRAAAPMEWPTKTSTFLSDALLSWSVSDVLNENLYRDKVVEHIPIKFSSIEHYIHVYSALLLEETRSLLCSDIQNIADAQFCKLLSVEPCDSRSMFYLDIDLEATSSEPINCYHVAKNFDICMLSTTSPKDSDFKVESCCLGIATEIGRDTFYQRSFKVSVATIEVFQPKKIQFVSFLSNISYKMEISKVLSLGDESHKRAIQALQDIYRKVGKRCSDCYRSPHCKDASVTLPLVSSLTSRLNCPHEEYTGVVCAPPGTLEGFVSVLLKEFIHLRKRVLICLPKEASISQFLSDIKETLSPSGKLDDILVVNSVKGLGTCSKFEKACLENKSQELYCYLEQCPGWLKCMSNLLELKAFNHSPRCLDSKKCERCHYDVPFSVQLFTERFSDIVVKFRDSLIYLVNNARAICLVDEDCDNILKLLNIMEKVEDLLHSNDLTDNCVIEVFGLDSSDGAAEMDTSKDKAKSLNEHRMSSIKLIDTLSKWLQLPQLENRDELDKFCLQHSSIIVTSLDCMGKLHGLELGIFDITIVTGAGQIREHDLLVPFVVPMRHIVFFGDHLHLQPSVQSEICKKARFNKSIYVRLQQLTSEKLVLTHQSVRHPMMNQIINNLFYNKKINDAPNIIPMKYNEDFKTLKLPAVSFLDVPSMLPKSKYSGKYDITFAAIILLLQDLGKDGNKNLSIGLVCLSNNEANAVMDQLGNEKEIVNTMFHLQVKVLGNLDGELFDVIIISTIVEDTADLIGVDANSLNIALTSSRHCCILIGRCKTLVHGAGITWKKVEKYLSKQNLIKTVDIKALIEVMKKLETEGIDHLNDPKYVHSRKMKPGQELTWHGRPSRTKHILADVRDQRGQPDTCVLQATSGAGDSLMKLHNSSLTPPQDCGWKLSVDDFKKKHQKVSEKKHEKVSEKEFTSEDIADRGIRRLIRAFEKFKEFGVEARNKCGTMEVKLSAYKEIVVDSELSPKSTEDVKNTLKDGNILVGSFRQSMNYYNLRPGEVYVFDEKKPIKHPRSNLTASHAVMIIGIGHGKISRPDRNFCHMAMQNSEGRLFGINGMGRVAKKSVRNLFHIELEKPGLEPF